MQVEHGIKKGQGPWAIGQKHKASHNLEAIQKLNIMISSLRYYKDAK